MISRLFRPCLILVLATMHGLCFSQERPMKAELIPDWENPEVFERAQEAPHTTLMPFSGLEEALGGRRKESPFHQSLNGKWRFHWAPNIEEMPEGFYREGYDHGDWEEITVPSNWQMEGFGYPIFRNIGLPHPMDPPYVPRDFNPVGSYNRTFTLPAGWEDREIFLHFEGVQSAFTLWVNGKECGYNQGGMEPAEFNISSLLKEGENNIALRVLRYCDGSYLEDQDTWRLSGIYRDVYLMAAPGLHIRDYYIQTDLDSKYRDAELKLEAEVVNYGRHRMEGWQLRTRLFDPSGREVTEGKGLAEPGPLPGGGSLMTEIKLRIADPGKWSAEYPMLYTLVMEVLTEEGKSLEFLSQKVGFREVEIRDQAILVNGVAVKLNGVNSHMMHPRTGHAMDTGTMRQDLELMKRFNINCVRTSHYPPNVEYLELAAEMGIYIVDECGDEAHAYEYLSDRPEWKEQYLDRMRKMVYRDRNQSAVILWSAGNESGWGENLCALMEEGRRIDPSRPAWMYGGNRDEDPSLNPIACEDVVGPRYLRPKMLELLFGRSEDPRPSFMDEYIAATGNSLGGLDDYWEVIRSYPRLTGGAIWDWTSTGIHMPVTLVEDESPNNVQCALMNRACLREGEDGKALYLSGNDDWMETYRHPALDVAGEALTLAFSLKPERYNGSAIFLCKGDYQFGIVQIPGDSLRFYLQTDQGNELDVALPENWVGSWHQVCATYNGSMMRLYLDGDEAGALECSGRIKNAPFPVMLGKSAELRDNHRGYMCHATMDRVRILTEALTPSELETVSPEKAALWLDFESEKEEGEFYFTGIPGRTYGLVWPDRSIQPELWQLKKSPQSVLFNDFDQGVGMVRVRNLHHFRNLKEVDMYWMLSEDGIVIQEGQVAMDLPAGEEGELHVPYNDPEIREGSIYHLLLSCRTKEDQSWAPAGHEVAWEQFEFLPASDYDSGGQNSGGQVSEETDPERILNKQADKEKHPSVEEEGKLLRIRAGDVVHTFDKTRGKLVSLQAGGREVIESGPEFNVWRAPLANDLDAWNEWHTEMGYVLDWMGAETANGWRSVGLDSLKQEVLSFSWGSNEKGIVLEVELSSHNNDRSTGYRIHQFYFIDKTGAMDLETRVSPWGFQPRWLPKVGLSLELAEEFRDFEWLGRGPFENYPDRKTGAKIGRYRSNVDEDFVPYIIPQDYGNKCDVRWIRLSADGEDMGLFCSSNESFNVSVHKYSTDMLDRAFHSFQLKDEGRVILNLDHRVSGVGGTARSVLNQYRVFPEEYEFSFRIVPETP